MTVEIRALRPDDDRSAFRSGDVALDTYFQRHAGQNQFRHHVGVTYVAVTEGRILGFVTVSPATMDADAVPSKRRLPPYPVPVHRLARLAADERFRGAGIGRALLRFSIELAERLRDEFGCRARYPRAGSDVPVAGIGTAPERVTSTLQMRFKALLGDPVC